MTQAKKLRIMLEGLINMTDISILIDQHYNNCKALWDRGELSLALNELEHVERLNPQSLNIERHLRWKTNLLFDMKKYDVALEYNAKRFAISHDPDDLLGRAVILDHMGEKEQALEMLGECAKSAVFYKERAEAEKFLEMVAYAREEITAGMT